MEDEFEIFRVDMEDSLDNISADMTGIVAGQIKNRTIIGDSRRQQEISEIKRILSSTDLQWNDYTNSEDKITRLRDSL